MRSSFQRLRIRCIAAAAALCAFGGTAVAQAPSFPSQPIRLVIGYPPGGSGDPLLRRLAEAARPVLGQAIVIENKAGAGTNIASEYVARSPADGYTLLVGGDSSHGINQALYPKLGFDPQKDFVPITKLVALPMVIAVHPSLGVNSLGELVKKAKAEPGSVQFASSGNGAPTHLAGVMLNKAAGIELAHIPYRGGGPAATAVLGGEPKVLIGSAAQMIPHMATGRLKGLAVTSAKSTPVLPGIPGASEAGVQGLDRSAYLGLWAPAGTPPDVVQRLFAAFSKALNDPNVRQDLAKMGMAADPSRSPADFDAFVKADAAVWARLVKESGATIN